MRLFVNQRLGSLLLLSYRVRGSLRLTWPPGSSFVRGPFELFLRHRHVNDESRRPGPSLDLVPTLVRYWRKALPGTSLMHVPTSLLGLIRPEIGPRSADSIFGTCMHAGICLLHRASLPYHASNTATPKSSLSPKPVGLHISPIFHSALERYPGLTLPCFSPLIRRCTWPANNPSVILLPQHQNPLDLLP
jgi:hypothetical protein